MHVGDKYELIVNFPNDESQCMPFRGYKSTGVNTLLFLRGKHFYIVLLYQIVCNYLTIVLVKILFQELIFVDFLGMDDICRH